MSVLVDDNTTFMIVIDRRLKSAASGASATPRREKDESSRQARSFAALRMTGVKYGVEYDDRKVSMSEASGRAVESLSK